eukprot:780759-Pyramimonas_sp.AAC.2
MLAGPKRGEHRAVGESGVFDTGRERKGTGLWGGVCTLAVSGTGGPVYDHRRLERVTHTTGAGVFVLVRLEK